MSRITELVPNIELCKKIPMGKFAKTTFVWVEIDENYRKVDFRIRPKLLREEDYPAPTLQELLEEIGEFIMSKSTCSNGENKAIPLTEIHGVKSHLSLKCNCETALCDFLLKYMFVNVWKIKYK